MLTVLCGLNEEADVVTDKVTSQVLWGTARHNLDKVVARGCSAILSFGISGALTPTLRVGDIVLSSPIVTPDDEFHTDTEWCKRLSHLATHVGRTFSSGKVEGADGPSRAKLFNEHKTIAVDDESFFAVEFARETGIPMIAIRAISDSVDTILPSWALKVTKPDGTSSFQDVCHELLRHPTQIFDMVKIGLDFEKSLWSLRKVYKLAGPSFLAFP